MNTIINTETLIDLLQSAEELLQVASPHLGAGHLTHEEHLSTIQRVKELNLRMPTVAKETRRQAIVELAQDHCGDNEIDENAIISEGDENGCYVQSWTWCPFEGTEFDKETKRYIFICDHTAAICRIPNDYSSDDWEDALRAFGKRAHPRKSWSDVWVTSYQLDEAERKGSVYWHWELAGPSGAAFQILPTPESTEEEIDAAIDYLKAQRDVAHLRRTIVKAWIEFDPALATI